MDHPSADVQLEAAWAAARLGFEQGGLLVDAVRTPMGRSKGGMFWNVRATPRAAMRPAASVWRFALISPDAGERYGTPRRADASAAPSARAASFSSLLLAATSME